MLGDFVVDAYADEYESAGVDFEGHVTELSFAADKENVDNAVTAMKHHISKKLNKGWHDVTNKARGL
tara:strand:- start:2750 stop:2950 length:201 start_codon:yes stop_codon:yes gene_type:complete